MSSATSGQWEMRARIHRPEAGATREPWVRLVLANGRTVSTPRWAERTVKFGLMTAGMAALICFVRFVPASVFALLVPTWAITFGVVKGLD